MRRETMEFFIIILLVLAIAVIIWLGVIAISTLLPLPVT